MPAIDDMWDAYDAKQHDKVISLIEKNPSLVNAVNKKLPVSLLQCAILGKRPNEFIQSLITHPDFNFNFMQKYGSNRAVFVGYAKIELITKVLEDPKFLFSNTELAYSAAVIAQAEFRKSLKQYEAKNPGTAAALSLQEKIKSLDTIIPMLRNATLKYAIQKDDVDLLLRLKEAGDNVTSPLGEEDEFIFPHNMAKDGSKAKTWILDELNQQTQKFKSTPTAMDNRYRMYQQTQKDLDELRIKHAKEQGRLYDEIEKEREAFKKDVESMTSKRH
ncbi:hypothetical protein J2N86_13580 [Legionella lytica]|uniref:Uncharacterized protein n=1 Tax=Legionella lytica TaxID=96232 RepID=A0ABY4Y951_9GAMM|nr:hypothetical protein [Legionella lytica]USQ13687.1 hypothetical protein J2N86_13580 [Legionella lytica]